MRDRRIQSGDSELLRRSTRLIPCNNSLSTGRYLFMLALISHKSKGVCFHLAGRPLFKRQVRVQRAADGIKATHRLHLSSANHI